MQENTASIDSQWADWFRGLGTAAANLYLANQQQQQQPAPAAQPAVPRWAIFAGIGAAVLLVVVLLRR